MKLTFLGSAGTVTGSKYLVTEGDAKVLVDCGLFQGDEQLRLRNWGPLSVAPASLSAVILTHAHLDHTGAQLHAPTRGRGVGRVPVFDRCLRGRPFRAVDVAGVAGELQRTTPGATTIASGLRQR